MAHSPNLRLFHLIFFFIIFVSNTQGDAVSSFLKLPLLHTTTSFPSHHHHHHHHHATLKSPITSGASSGTGQYFVSLRLGTPPQAFFLVADTGSDLIWVKSSPCKTNCSLHHHPPSSSIFFPRLSSSFSPIHCFHSLCQLVPHPPNNSHCNHSILHSPCRYSYSYSDGSSTSGIFSQETATFNSHRTKLIRLAFGSGFNVSGPSLTGPSFNGAQGVMGLGRGPISFPSQMGPYFGNKFSYCLMDYTLSPSPTSYLVIGENDVIPKGISFTPLLTNPIFSTFYYIGIQSVFVNGVKLRINPSVWSIDHSGNGGTIMDSGTTLTLFVQPAYSQILKAFKKLLKRIPKSVQPFGFDLCLNVSGFDKLVLPRMSFQMVGGEMFSPPPRNYFIDTGEGVKCLAVQPVVTQGGFSVFGNLIQQGFLLEFDRDWSRLGFSRRGCALP